MYDYDDYQPLTPSVGEQLGLIFWIAFGVIHIFGLLMFVAL